MLPKVDERTISEIDRLKELAAETSAPSDLFLVSFNLSEQSFSDGMLDNMFSENVHLCKAELIVEVLETHKLDEHSVAEISKYREDGFNMAMDDFGSVPSALDVVCKPMFNVIKIDKSLLPDNNADTDRYTVLKSIVDLFHEFGKTIIIEGVETKEQVQLSIDLGIDVIQG
jgi:EAL domain-containing protein (putative c-di-GMP-specific phosphodiesterase class I)